MKRLRINALFSMIFCFALIFIASGCEEQYPITKTVDGYTFKVDENQNAILIKVDHSTEIMKVPQTISSYNVKKLSCVEKAALVGVSLTGVFEGNNVVKEIIIPEGVVETYGPAIADCYNLEKISIPSTMTTFDVVRCDKLKEINIADGNTVTDSFGFSDCSNLVSIVLPTRINEISDNAFARCYSLKNIKIPDNVLSIGSTAFQSCSSLRIIDLPNELTEIGSNAFQWCVSLQCIDIPSKVKSIECWSFDGCNSLNTVNLPEKLTAISEGAFRNCTTLEQINVYDRCTRIADNAFEGCDKLTIYGIKGSYAEQYANEHNIPFKELL